MHTQTLFGCPAGLPISEDGCSAQQLVEFICDEGSFPNHGPYVSGHPGPHDFQIMISVPGRQR